MRRAQAAVEYLFMIAIALVMVLIAIRLAMRTVENATQNLNETTGKLIKILQNMTNE
ncbi:class III signal peptide-containing protein [Thermococcus sp.]|uniref:class III signal peptide-containing protein n=1 Tax=Thermococcus sp. TaxID=35749 RepID=UPI002608C346|nr:class III signal peptide-containing protein [Thermococcus sp.]